MLSSWSGAGASRRGPTSKLYLAGCGCGCGSKCAPPIGSPGAYAVRGAIQPYSGALTSADASGYILGWLQEAEKEAEDGPKREAVKALIRGYSAGQLANEPSSYQLGTVYPVLAAMAPDTAARMRRQVEVLGSSADRAAVKAAAVRAKEAGIEGVRGLVPGWALGLGGALVIVVIGGAVFAATRRSKR